MRKRKGFTLAELLIVVAIIGVLVAIAIPVFTSSLEKAREAVCMSNLTASQHVVTYEWMLNDKLSADEALKLIEQAVGDPDELCPYENGHYSVESNPSGNGFVVRCSKHGITAVEVVNNKVEKLAEAVQSYFLNEHGVWTGKGELDSSGPNFGGEIKENLAKTLNTTIDFDFRIWRNPSGGSYVVYVFEPTEKKTKGETVTATRYYFTKDWKQENRKEKGMAPLKEKITNDKNGKPVTHLVLDAENFKVS